MCEGVTNRCNAAGTEAPVPASSFVTLSSRSETVGGVDQSVTSGRAQLPPFEANSCTSEHVASPSAVQALGIEAAQWGQILTELRLRLQQSAGEIGRIAAEWNLYDTTGEEIQHLHATAEQRRD